MPLRHAVIAALAVGVLGMGVYLFVQVRSTPALAEVRTADRLAITKAAPHPPSEAPPTPTRATPGVHSAAPPPQLSAASGGDDDDGPHVANPRIEAAMDQANKAYDRQDFEEAKYIAGRVLAKQPTNVRMMRIMVSASCIDGDAGAAQKFYELLPKADREQMRARCDRYGFSFKEPAQ